MNWGAYSQRRAALGPPGQERHFWRGRRGEAGVPSLSISGSDFVEMFVGVGARVRDLFDQAKKLSPRIVFIDDRRRGVSAALGVGGGHDEREQTLNQLSRNGWICCQCEGIIIIAATNRPDTLILHFCAQDV